MRVSFRMSSRVQGVRAAALLAVWAFLPVLPVYAHGIQILAWTRGETVIVRGRWGNRQPVSGGRVAVFDPPGTRLLEGETGPGGEFSFIRPVREPLRIVLTGGPGHRAEYHLPPSPGSEVPGEVPPAEAGSRRTGDRFRDRGDAAAATNPRQELEARLDERLASIERNLADLAADKGPGVTEIVGGIGYIVGLMGIGLYFNGRRKGNRSSKPRPENS